MSERDETPEREEEKRSAWWLFVWRMEIHLGKKGDEAREKAPRPEIERDVRERTGGERGDTEKTQREGGGASRGWPGGRKERKEAEGPGRERPKWRTGVSIPVPLRC